MYLKHLVKKNNELYIFCFQNFFYLVNNLHTSSHPDIIGLFKNLIFHKIYKQMFYCSDNIILLQSQHCIPRTFRGSLNFFIFRSASLQSLLFLIHYRNISLNWKNTKLIVFSICLLRHGVLRVFVSFCVLVFVRAILSWCP